MRDRDQAAKAVGETALHRRAASPAGRRFANHALYALACMTAISESLRSQKLRMPIAIGTLVGNLTFWRRAQDGIASPS